MERVDVSTVVYVPPEEVFEFLWDFPRYGEYSEYLTAIDRSGDGSAGTCYDITVSWWRLTHTIRSEVTALDPPERIEWRVLGRVAAHGAWVIEPAPDRAPPDVETATVVTLAIDFDPDSVGSDYLDLPAFVSLDRVIDRVAPKVESEARATVERIVADLEGEPRSVELDVETYDG